jgi:hypothetical protein
LVVCQCHSNMWGLRYMCVLYVFFARNIVVLIVCVAKLTLHVYENFCQELIVWYRNYTYKNLTALSRRCVLSSVVTSRQIAQVVTDLQQAVTRLLSSWYQDVFALLVPSCCDKSETSCYHLVTRLMMVTDFLQVVPKRLIQSVRNKLLRACCHQLVNNLFRVCRPHQLCCEMITICSKLVNNWEQAVRTQLVDKLWDFYLFFYACNPQT